MADLTRLLDSHDCSQVGCPNEANGKDGFCSPCRAGADRSPIAVLAGVDMIDDRTAATRMQKVKAHPDRTKVVAGSLAHLMAPEHDTPDLLDDELVQHRKIGPEIDREALDALMEEVLPEYVELPDQEDEKVTTQWQPVWNQGTALDAVKTWAAEHDGRPPTNRDAIGSKGVVPSPSTAKRLFGNWANMIEQAGFDRPVRGGGKGGRRIRPASVPAGDIAVEGLVSLGWKEVDAVSALSTIDPTLPPEERIKLALNGHAVRPAAMQQAHREMQEPPAPDPYPPEGHLRDTLPDAELPVDDDLISLANHVVKAKLAFDELVASIAESSTAYRKAIADLKAHVNGLEIPR